MLMLMLVLVLVLALCLYLLLALLLLSQQPIRSQRIAVNSPYEFVPSQHIYPANRFQNVVVTYVYRKKPGELGCVHISQVSIVRRLHDKGIKPNSERLRFLRWPMVRDTNGLASRDML